MTRTQKRLLALILGLAALLVLLAAVYTLAMAHLEGRERTFWQGLEWAAGSLSTTGFGPDTTWEHPVMVVLVTLVEFIGVFLIFLLVPVFLIPFLEERLGRRLPSPPSSLARHLVLYRWGPAVETLAERAAEAGVPVLVIEPDAQTARQLAERRALVIHGRPEEAVFERARLRRARALVTNGTDEENGFAVLVARDLGYEGQLVALAEEPLHRRALALAGATHVFTPRHVLGAALAARASSRVSPFVAGLDTLGGRLKVRELRIERGSDLAGRIVGEATIGTRTGSVLLGLWRRGRFVAPVQATTRIEARDVIIAAGDEDSLDQLALLAGGPALRHRTGKILVAGYGEAGRAATDILRAAGEEVVTLDSRELEGVDQVGDVRHLRTLEAAGVATAKAVIVALPEDAATLFTTLLLRELSPDGLVVARAAESANVDRIHRAGADFVLSTGQVAGQIIAGALFGREALGIEGGLELAEIEGGPWVGRLVAGLDLRERTGCSLVAIGRGEEVLVSLSGLTVDAGDRLYLCGSPSSIARITLRSRK
ncbi:MAG TPA: NAD-binding protein [Thermoanaerobaculia bacterium]|nr:NAD-binding protein [Thermoanaerobaculia bacterium]